MSIDLDQYRALLIGQREQLKAIDETGRQAAETVELDQTRVGRLSRMDAMQAQAMSIATNQRRARQLQRIEAALQRIAAGDYGDCQSCAEPIAGPRLGVDPAATLCIQCAEKQQS